MSARIPESTKREWLREAVRADLSNVSDGGDDTTEKERFEIFDVTTQAPHERLGNVDESVELSADASDRLRLLLAYMQHAAKLANDIGAADWRRSSESAAFRSRSARSWGGGDGSLRVLGRRERRVE